MTNLLKNPRGIIVEIDDDSEFKECSRKPGFTVLTPEEVKVYFLKRGLRTEEKTSALDIFFVAPKQQNDGYGSLVKHLENSLLLLGIKLDTVFDNQQVGLACGYPEMLNYLSTPIKILLTMFESTKIPAEWHNDLRKADLIIVPSKFCQKAFKDAGFDTEIIPLAYNKEIFTFKEKDPDKEPFIFLHYNAFDQRKGWDVVFSAFNKEFRSENVRLVLKTTKLAGYPFPILKSQYPQIDVIKEEYKTEELAELLHKSDCFVFPSRGEGFGIPPLEALATGTPVIVPNAHGISEYFSRNYFLGVDIKGEVPALYDRYRNVDVGKMVEPDVESLRRQMRFAYEHRSYVFDMAKKGANWVKDQYTWEKTAKAFIAAVKKLQASKPVTNTVIPVEPEEVVNEEDKVIFLTEDTQHITGGRYYSWWLATALQAAGEKVIIYTNRQPVFLEEFKDYPQPEVRIVKEIGKVNVKGKFYVGSPIIGNIAAIKLGEKYNKPTYVEIFDPFPMMEKYRGQHNWQGWDELIGLMRKPHVNIISLCETTSFWIYEWLNKSKKQVFEINPCINSKARDASKEPKRKNWVTFISRLDFHKKLDHVLAAVKDTDCELHVITSVDGINFPRMIKEYGMTNQVVIHRFVSDREKFEIIKKSKVVINAAIFEGFGIWLTEALSCGTPVVCYDYPTFKEIAEIIDKKHRQIYFAKYKDPEDLKKKLKKALKEEKVTEGTRSFDFPVMVKRIKQVFKPDPKIGVITIGLNEEEFIGASLRSMFKQKEVAKIAVVEGCVTLNESQANENGLSKDNTESEILKVITEDKKGKIIYDKYGWAGSKSELRNRGLKLLGREVDYIMVVDADEVWKKEDFDGLVKFIKKNPDVSVVWYPAYHFWKQKDLIAVGGQWEAPLFRFFKYEDKSLHWNKHQTPVVTENGDCVTTLGRQASLKTIHFYHYGAMKPEAKILAKLEYYAKRDKDLTVKNTWSNWKKGKATQWTHGGGSAAKFTGTHPVEILKLWEKQN